MKKWIFIFNRAKKKCVDVLCLICISERIFQSALRDRELHPSHWFRASLQTPRSDGRAFHKVQREEDVDHLRTTQLCHGNSRQRSVRGIRLWRVQKDIIGERSDDSSRLGVCHKALAGAQACQPTSCRGILDTGKTRSPHQYYHNFLSSISPRNSLSEFLESL